MKLILLFVAVFSAIAATSASAITYTVDRLIGSGSVTGFIETDDTLGTLSDTNIIDWSITLASPDLLGGSPQTITAATSGVALVGSGLSASATEITFDFDAAPGIFAIASTGAAWCMSTAGSSCTTEPPDASEGIFFGTPFPGPAELVARSGVVTLATAAPPAVPLPTSLPLLAVALGGLAVARRRKAA